MGWWWGMGGGVWVVGDGDGDVGGISKIIYF